MARSGEDARKRLMQAALELFLEKGFDQTTAAQIAAKAGVTERTFFRHFPDKREALFVGQSVLDGAFSDAIAALPDGLSPIEMLRRVFEEMTPVFEQNRGFSEPRQRVIAATPALREREIGKNAALVHVVANAMHKKGIEHRRALLAAQTGLAVLQYAIDVWFADPSTKLSAHLDRAFAEFDGLS